MRSNVELVNAHIVEAGKRNAEITYFAARTAYGEAIESRTNNGFYLTSQYNRLGEVIHIWHGE